MKKALFILAILILALGFAFQNDELNCKIPIFKVFQLTPPTSLKIDLPEQDGKFNDIILKYLEVSKDNDLQGLAPFYARVPLSYIEYRLQEAQNAVNAGKNNVSLSSVPALEKSGLRTVTPNKSIQQITSKVERPFIINTFPTLLKNRILIFKEIKQSWIKGNEGRIRVLFECDKYPSQAILFDFFVYKEDEGEWQIFRISQKIESETYPL